MPIYEYTLKNGKTLTLEGDTQPTDADVEEAARSAGVELSLAGEPDTPQGSTLMRTLSGMGKRALETPMNVLTGLKNLVTSPIESAKGLYENQMRQFDKAGEAAAQGRYSEMFGHGAAGLLPLIGPAAADAGEAIGSGNAEQAGAGIVDAGLMLAGAAPSASLSAAKSMARGVGRAARNPVVRTAAGAGVGYATGGLPGAAAGAAGGGLIGQIERAMGRVAPEASGVTEVPAISTRATWRQDPHYRGRMEFDAPREMPPEPGPTGSVRWDTPVDPERAAVKAFNTQTPEVLAAERFAPGEVGGSVAAPGFDLGPMTAMSDVPSSVRTMGAGADDAAQAAQSMQRGSGIDWRTTDAVPIDAMKRSGTILEAGESRIGLAEQLAEAMKTNNLGRAAELAKAIRQRMHIGASGR